MNEIVSRKIFYCKKNKVSIGEQRERKEEEWKCLEEETAAPAARKATTTFPFQVVSKVSWIVVVSTQFKAT